jgi:hypothetical protein
LNLIKNLKEVREDVARIMVGSLVALRMAGQYAVIVVIAQLVAVDNL